MAKPNFTVRKDAWYDLVQVEDSPGEVHAYIYDAIGGWGESAKSFIADILALKDVSNLKVHINSPGGDVFDGLAIYNFLVQRPYDVHIIVDGLAASIASVVAMSGKTVTIPENAFLMIHNAWTFVAGDSAELRQMADTMDKFNAAIAGIYAKRSGKSMNDVRALMDAETWMDGKSAHADGFCDTCAEPVEMAACFDIKRYKNMPENVRASMRESKMANESDVAVKPVSEEPAAVAEPAAPVTVQPEPAAETAPAVDARAEIKAEFKAVLRQYISEFGNEGVTFFLEDVTIDQAKLKLAEAIRAENALLKKQLAEKPTPAASFAAADKLPTLWQEYHAIKDPKAKTMFYRKHRAEMDS